MHNRYTSYLNANSEHRVGLGYVAPVRAVARID